MTRDRTRHLLRQGMSIGEVARRRGLTRGTITNHVEILAGTDEQFDLDPHLPPPERIEKINAAFEEMGGLNMALAPVKEIVGEDCTYEEIRLVRIYLRRLDP